jgi:4-oxalocrotonate tautomerase
VLIEEYDRENWSTGGKLRADKFGPGYGKAGAPG